VPEEIVAAGGVRHKGTSTEEHHQPAEAHGHEEQGDAGAP
jgi:hypothetical protein